MCVCVYVRERGSVNSKTQFFRSGPLTLRGSGSPPQPEHCEDQLYIWNRLKRNVLSPFAGTACWVFSTNLFACLRGKEDHWVNVGQSVFSLHFCDPDETQTLWVLIPINALDILCINVWTLHVPHVHGERGCSASDFNFSCLRGLDHTETLSTLNTIDSVLSKNPHLGS